MHMTFWWSIKIDHFLFYWINVKDLVGLLLTCFIIGSLAFTFEWIKLVQAQHRQKDLILRSKQLKLLCPMTTETNSLLSGRHNRNTPVNVTLKHRILSHAFDIFLWFSLHNLGYFIMLAVMMYNGWMLVSVLLGGGIGYFVFGARFMKLNVENCQVIRDTYCMSKCTDTETQAEGVSTPVLQASPSSSTTHNTDTSVDVHNPENLFFAD